MFYNVNQENQKAQLDVAQYLLLQFFVRQMHWSVTPIDFMSNQFLLLFLARKLNQTSELNESANHLAKNTRNKHVRKCHQRLQVFSCVLISRDKNFILLLVCFALIFTRLLTLLSLPFCSHSSLSFYSHFFLFLSPSFSCSARTESNTESAIFTNISHSKLRYIRVKREQVNARCATCITVN